jgi:hypothetical protein
MYKRSLPSSHPIHVESHLEFYTLYVLLIIHVPGCLILQHPQSLGFQWEDWLGLLLRFTLGLFFVYRTKDRVSLAKALLEDHH